MSKATMKLGHGEWRRFSQQRQDMGLALGQLLLAQLIDIQADAMSCSLYWMDELKWHWEVASGPARPTLNGRGHWKEFGRE